MERQPLELLTAQVQEYFRRHARKYGLRADGVQARYLLNWGGFVNASFQISDGAKLLHLKLADDEEDQERLQRWKLFQRPLAERYRAPRVLDWVKIPRSPFAGLLLEGISGRPVDLAAQPEILRGLLDLLPRLHGDRLLAAALQALDGPPVTCGEYFLSVYIDRFDQDLMEIIPRLPPFVPLPLFDWMQSETRDLEGLARDLPVFQGLADWPVHGDLGPNNLLVTETGDWHLIDWDDLALGDPALEYSMVLAVLPESQREALLPANEDLRARFAVCQRALLLDQVIDPLADWVEAEFAPEHLETVRAQKEAQHKAALAEYREKYTG